MTSLLVEPLARRSRLRVVVEVDLRQRALSVLADLHDARIFRCSCHQVDTEKGFCLHRAQDRPDLGSMCEVNREAAVCEHEPTPLRAADCVRTILALDHEARERLRTKFIVTARCAEDEGVGADELQHPWRKCLITGRAENDVSIAERGRQVWCGEPSRGGLVQL